MMTMMTMMTDDDHVALSRPNEAASTAADDDYIVVLKTYHLYVPDPFW